MKSIENIKALSTWISSLQALSFEQRVTKEELRVRKNKEVKLNLSVTYLSLILNLKRLLLL